MTPRKAGLSVSQPENEVMSRDRPPHPEPPPPPPRPLHHHLQGILQEQITQQAGLRLVLISIQKQTIDSKTNHRGSCSFQNHRPEHPVGDNGKH